jgi:hypothetical protein
MKTFTLRYLYHNSDDHKLVISLFLNNNLVSRACTIKLTAAVINSLD